MEEIIKYNNRKLYSKSMSQYATLEYINDLIKTDQKFTINAHGTGEEKAGEVLIQVLIKNLTKQVKNGTMGKDELTKLIKELNRGY